MSKYIKGQSNVWKDLTGQKFNRLLILGFLPNKKWECLCDCGNITEVFTKEIKSNHTRSCGCLQRELASKANKTHGMRGTREYISWKAMKSRCYNIKNKDAKYYLEKNITVCERWINSFENFYKDMGNCPENHSLDRIDVEGNYTPENCKWSSNTEQARNKTTTLVVEYNGEKYSLINLCEKLNLHYGTVYERIYRYGWSITRALDTKTKRIFK